MSRSLAFQTKVYAVLDAALAIPVEAHPTHSRSLPYVLIGHTQSTDSPVGEELFIDIHVWSKTRGPHEVRGHQKTIYDALHNQTLDQDGVDLICIRQDDRQDFLDEDNETWHGVQTFRCLAV